MANETEKAIDLLTASLGAEAAKAVGSAVDDLKKETESEVGKQVLGWMQGMIEANGADGIVALKDWVKSLVEGDGKVVIPEGTPIRVSSDILATLQNKEANEMNKFRDTMIIIGDSLGVILLGIVKGLIK